jgi:hypothetical protein
MYKGRKKSEIFTKKSDHRQGYEDVFRQSKARNQLAISLKRLLRYDENIQLRANQLNSDPDPHPLLPLFGL